MSKKTSAIIVLGHAVSENGQLSTQLKERLDTGIELYNKLDNWWIIVSGGKGDHFNRTKHSLAHHMKQYLMEQSVQSENIIE